MTPEEELELIQIRRARLRQGGGAPAPAPVAPQRSFLEELTTGPMGLRSFRETGAAMLAGPFKGLTGLIDLTTLAKQKAGVPHSEQVPFLTPYVDKARDWAAGRPLGSETPTAIAEGAFGGLPGMFASGTTNELINRGVNPLVAGAAGLAVPGAMAATGAAVRAASLDPRKVLARTRLEEAVSGSDPTGLQEAAKTQALAAKNNIFITPSQGSARQMPGLDQLETEAILSSTKSAGPLRERIFNQALDADRVSREVVAQAGRPGNADEMAAALQRAAVERLRADQTRQSRVAGPFYEAGHQANVPVARTEIELSIKNIRDRMETLKGNREFAQGAKDLIRRLDELVPKAKKGATSKDATAPQLYRAHQSFLEDLAKPDAKGVPQYSDNVAKELRKLSEDQLRNVFEKAEPNYETARKLMAGMRGIDARTPFDPLTAMSQTRNADTLLQGLPRQGGALQEVARGREVFKQLPTGDALESAIETVGANPQAVSNALATSLERFRQKAFSPGTTGLANPSASASFARNIAGTPEGQQQLLLGINAAGGDTARTTDLLELARALGRQTVVPGARIPGTEIEPMQFVRMGIGNELSKNAARLGIVRSVLNRLSDAEVIRFLSQPESVKALMNLGPAVARASPREKAFAIMAVPGQVDLEQFNK